MTQEGSTPHRRSGKIRDRLEKADPGELRAIIQERVPHRAAMIR
jgi:hypothetical protein